MGIESGKGFDKKSQPQEVKREAPPVHIILGPHTDSSVPGLAHLDKSIGDNLKKTKSGDVVVFVEDGYGYQGKADLMEHYMEGGLPPSISYKLTNFFEKNAAEPDLKNPQQLAEVKKLWGEVDSFTRTELSIIDKHFDESQRIRILWEAGPNKEVLQEFTQLESAKKTVEQEGFSAIFDGDFDRGLPSYRAYVESFAEHTKTRDERLAEKIDKISQNPNTAAIVGHRGDAHADLQKILSEKGHPVIAVFAEDAYDQVLLHPLDEVMRKKMVLSPGEELSEVDLYRGLIGDTMYVFTKKLVSESTVSMDKEEILQLTRLGLTHLPDMESIRRFERDVRENGFQEALTHLGED